MEMIKALFGLGGSCEKPKSIHQFMTECAPRDRKSVYLEAARLASQDQKDLIERDRKKQAG